MHGGDSEKKGVGYKRWKIGSRWNLVREMASQWGAGPTRERVLLCIDFELFATKEGGMMRSLLIGLAVAVLGVTMCFGSADAQISFSQGYVNTIGGDFLLTIPEISSGTVQGWVTWKLNFGTIAWDLVDFGLTADVPKLGPRTANGRYVYNAAKAVLVLDIEFSNFLGCGIDRGIEVLDVSGITDTALTFTIIDPLEELQPVLCTRAGGAPGDIVGSWSCNLGDAGSLTMDLKQDRTVTISGVMQNCLLD